MLRTAHTLLSPREMRGGEEEAVSVTARQHDFSHDFSHESQHEFANKGRRGGGKERLPKKKRERDGMP